MSTKAKDKGSIAKILDEELTDSALDQVLTDRHEEVDLLLEEARKAKAEGRFTPLEPLHKFLRRARERLKARR